MGVGDLGGQSTDYVECGIGVYVVDCFVSGVHVKNLFGFMLNLFIFTFVMHERVSSGSAVSGFLIILGVASFMGILVFAHKFYEGL